MEMAAPGSRDHLGRRPLVGRPETVGRVPDSIVAIADPEPKLSALPDAGEARVKVVRALIAEGEGDLNYEARDRIVSAAPLLTDDELIAALELVADPNYAIESFCMDETFPLERQIKLLSHFVEIQESEGMPDAIQAAAYRFAQIDPAATREWVRIFEPGAGSGQALSAVFERLEATDHAAALAMYCDLDDREAEAMIDYGNMVKLDPLSGREFVEWVKTFRSDKLRDFHLRQTVVWHLAKDDPEDALAYIRELPVEERFTTHGRHLVQAWARADDRDFPAIIERMTSDLPEETRSPETFYVLAEAWYNAVPEDALSWIGTLEAGASRDAAVSGYLRDSLYSDPVAGYALASTISATAGRQSAVGRALRILVEEDPDAARALIGEADLSENDRRNIERDLKKK